MIIVGLKASTGERKVVMKQTGSIGYEAVMAI
jgi:hypothetical protein